MSDYEFAESVWLRVRGSERVVGHFDAEYGESRGTAAEPDVDVRIGFGLGVDRIAGGALVAGGYKTARWRIALGPPEERPLRAEIALAGGPPSVALSLVQGWFTEALVALALAGKGRVALPSAAFAGSGGATVLLGRSGAGKTTLTARALAAGRTVLSDDQVIVDAGGRVWRYPRRLRFYPDLKTTAPNAWSRLTASTRAALLRRARVVRLTRGYVAPSLAVPASEIGATVAQGPLPVRRLVVVHRSPQSELTVASRTPAWAVERAETVLAEQRARLRCAVDGQWVARLTAVQEAEAGTVAAALADMPVTEVVVPRAWDARRSVDALEAYLDDDYDLASGPARAPLPGPAPSTA